MNDRERLRRLADAGDAAAAALLARDEMRRYLDAAFDAPAKARYFNQVWEVATERERDSVVPFLRAGQGNSALHELVWSVYQRQDRERQDRERKRAREEQEHRVGLIKALRRDIDT